MTDTPHETRGASGEIVIDALVRADENWVQLDPPRVRIPRGTEVVWSFSGVPDDERPALLFESFVPRAGDRTGRLEPFRGPFRRLVRRGHQVRGSVSRGVPGEYSYKVCLVSANEEGALVRELDCHGVSAGGLVEDPGPRSG